MVSYIVSLTDVFRYHHAIKQLHNESKLSELTMILPDLFPESTLKRCYPLMSMDIETYGSIPYEEWRVDAFTDDYKFGSWLNLKSRHLKQENLRRQYFLAIKPTEEEARHLVIMTQLMVMEMIVFDWCWSSFLGSSSCIYYNGRVKFGRRKCWTYVARKTILNRIVQVLQHWTKSKQDFTIQDLDANPCHVVNQAVFFVEHRARVIQRAWRHYKSWRVHEPAQKKQMIKMFESMKIR
jgi:hypothetical protein